MGPDASQILKKPLILITSCLVRFSSLLETTPTSQAISGVVPHIEHIRVPTACLYVVGGFSSMSLSSIIGVVTVPSCQNVQNLFDVVRFTQFNGIAFILSISRLKTRDAGLVVI